MSAGRGAQRNVTQQFSGERFCAALRRGIEAARRNKSKRMAEPAPPLVDEPTARGMPCRAPLALRGAAIESPRKSAVTRSRNMNNRVDHNMTTTALELPGYRIVRSLGLVRGIVVRSRSIFGTIGASLQTIFGGNITLFTELCEKTREEALDLMLQHAAERGGNAVVSMRYDANEVMQGVTEVLAYGTAVQVERVS